MDILEFQKKLKEIQILAVNNGKKVRRELVEKFFADQDMDEEKLKKVYDYLEIQGIRVEGIAETKAALKEETEEKKMVPLTAEEEEYLKDYLETLGEEVEAQEKELFQRHLAGEISARDGLTRLYQKEVIAAAREWNCEEVFFGDLLQEGNMGLLLALSEIEREEELKSLIQEKIHERIRCFLEEQTRQKKEDHILVEKVRTLEEKVKELTEGDKDVKYSVEELAVFLDMDVEDIQSVLRLTGDE